MFRLSPSRLYTTIGSQQRFSIKNHSGTERLDTNRRTLSRYPRQQARGVGQNLSDRYLRLEKSLREREALLSKKEELDRYSHNSESIPAVNTQSNPRSIKSLSKPVQLFHGFEIPEEPKPPADDGAFFFLEKNPVFSTHFVKYCRFFRMLYVWMRSLRV